MSEEKTSLFSIDGMESADQTVCGDAEHGGFPKLIHRSGNREYPLAGKPIRIGRASDNDIRLFSSKVSKHHLLVQAEADRYYAEDLKSTNGTKVNRSRICGRERLRHGDEIEIDADSFQFLLEKAYLYQEDRKPDHGSICKGKKRLFLILMPLLLPLMLGIVFLLATAGSSGSGPEKEGVSRTVAEPEGNLADASSAQAAERQKQVDAAYAAGAGFMERGEWDAASAEFNKILEIFPDNSKALEGIAIARFEKENLKIIQKALALIQKNRLSKGLEILKGIESGSAYFPSVQEKIAVIENEIAKAAAARKKQKRRQQRQRRRKKSQQAGPKEEQVSQEPQGTEGQSPVNAELTEEMLVAVREKGKELISIAMENYIKGDVAAAAEYLNGVMISGLGSEDPVMIRAVRMIEKMQAVKSLSEQADEFYHTGQLSLAYQAWDQILQIERKIVGNAATFFSNQVSLYMEEIFFAQAQKAFGNEQYAQARQHCDQVLSVNPRHKGSIAIQKKLNEMGEELVEEGNVLAGLNPELAVQKWKTAMDFCAGNSRCAKKAKTQIEQYR